MKIIKTSEALPKSGRYVLAWLEGAKIPMRAMWAAQHTLPLGDDADPEWGEYSEEKDEYFCPAGWYEMNQFEEQHWGVSGNVVAWCELPRLDHQCLAQIEEPAGAAPVAVARWGVAAWMTPEGDRVVTAETMDGARKDGGASLSSLRPYTVALVRAGEPAAAAPALEAPAAPVRQVLTDAQITHLQETRVGEPSPSRPIDASDWMNFARAIEAAALAALAKCDPAWRQGQRELLQYVARRACDPALPVDVVRAAHAAIPDELAARLRKAAATLAVRHSSYSNISIAWPDEKLLKSAEGRYHQALADLDALISAIPTETKQTADRDQLDSLARKNLGALLNAFGEAQWQAGRGVPCPSIEDAFEAVISAAVDLLAAAPQAPRLGEDALHLLRRLLSNQHTLTGPEFRSELEKIVAEESARHAAAPQAPAAPSAMATQVIENLLQLARIVNTAVEDWGETKEDNTLHVIFHKEQADKLEEILDFLDSLPDAPPEEGVILSGPSRAARVLRAQATPAAPVGLPSGWVPCILTHDGQHPEEVAYGPQIMMDRLKKWLGRYFELLAQKVLDEPVHAEMLAALQAVAVDVVHVGAGENAISDAARAKVEAVLERIGAPWPSPEAAPTTPDDVLCYIRAAATLPERHGFEVCRATDAGAMAVTGDGRAVVRAEPASKRIGQILSPASDQSQDTGSVVVAEIMSNGYNGQVLWKGKVPPVGTLLYAAPQAAPAAPAVDAQGERDAAFEAVRQRLCRIPRWSFHIDSRGNLRRVDDARGNWIEFSAAHELFDPVAVDSALAAQAAAKGAAS
ncbi:hypothetical protein [Delftia lacustris]|uniref:hypothetical protein n=1 Tax=Delftia lacustris TaxID=558537 RepID=UPI002D7922AF|nr:hypothetical protein [Delftia lacustris]